MTLLTYLKNPRLKAAGVLVEYTQDQVEDYIKCSKDPVYFIEKYCKIVSLDHGVVPFELFPYQKRMIEAIHNNKNSLGKMGRQLGKSTICAAYITWYIIFNEHKTAAILANKQSTAKEIFGRVQFMIEYLPQWLQQGVTEWNKTSLSLENGSKCFAAATSASAVRGSSINLLLLDEFAHLTPNLAEEFIASVFPTISSAESSKLIIISTPKGLNHYYKLWDDAEKGKNDFAAVTGHWTENKYRSQAWADKERAALGEVKYAQEVDCKFAGSSFTLIDGVKLAQLVFEDPIYNQSNLEIFAKPEKNRSYAMTVDVSRGRHLDYSAFSIFDITEMPYRVVATFKDNTISTLEFPHLIVNTCRQYNEAHILIEVNDLGEEVANTIWYEYEYSNTYFTKKEKLTQVSGHPGVRTTSKVKNLGCSVLKDLVEKDQLFVNSFRIVEELSRFVLQKKSYGADDKIINDDLCTTLWLFAWLTKQDYFQEITNNSLRAVLTKDRQAQINESMTPYKFFSSEVDSVTITDINSTKLPSKENPYSLTADQIELLQW